MSTSPTNHSATTALLASPQVQVAPVQEDQERNFTPGQNFSPAQRGGGYHRGEVDAWVHDAIEEIERLRRQAVSFIGREASSPRGQQTIAELLQLAADEATGNQQAAAQQTEQLIAGARQQAEQIITDARAKADQAISSATQQASALVAGARADAKKTTDAAAANAAAVDDAAGQRMSHYAKVHEDTIIRMRQMVDVLTANLKANDERGPLSTEVDRALAAVPKR